jgi:hypothetical protein
VLVVSLKLFAQLAFTPDIPGWQANQKCHDKNQPFNPAIAHAISPGRTGAARSVGWRFGAISIGGNGAPGRID